MQTYLPNGLILKPPKGMSVAGEYRFVVLDAAGQVKRETDWMPNLVTNAGLDALGASAGVGSKWAFCRIGTGNTAPAYTDTGLVSQSASTSNVIGSTTVNAGASNYETKTTTTFQFALGAVVGNMAEIGCGISASGADLCSRALIVDNVGSPTTITVLVTEILQVIYRFTCYPNLTDATGTVTIGGVSYNYVSRVFSSSLTLAVNPCTGTGYFGSFTGINAYPSTSTLGAITASAPSGTPAAFASGALSAYTSGNYYRDLTLNAALADANAAGGIAAIAFTINATLGGPVFNNQISFAAVSGGGPIPKDNTKALTITLRQFFSHH